MSRSKTNDFIAYILELTLSVFSVLAILFLMEYFKELDIYKAIAILIIYLIPTITIKNELNNAKECEVLKGSGFATITGILLVTLLGGMIFKIVNITYYKELLPLLFVAIFLYVVLDEVYSTNSDFGKIMAVLSFIYVGWAYNLFSFMF